MLRISCRHGHRKENNWQGSAAQVVANTRVNVSAGTFLMGSTKRVDRNEYLTEIRLAIRRRGMINPAWRTAPVMHVNHCRKTPIFT